MGGRSHSSITIQPIVHCLIMILSCGSGALTCYPHMPIGMLGICRPQDVLSRSYLWRELTQGAEI